MASKVNKDVKGVWDIRTLDGIEKRYLWVHVRGSQPWLEFSTCNKLRSQRHCSILWLLLFAFTILLQLNS